MHYARERERPSMRSIMDREKGKGDDWLLVNVVCVHLRCLCRPGNGNLRNAKVRKVICEITCEKCVRKIGKTRKMR